MDGSEFVLHREPVGMHILIGINPDAVELTGLFASEPGQVRQPFSELGENNSDSVAVCQFKLKRLKPGVVNESLVHNHWRIG